ncbi:MAG: CarD family transcriptional regulator [Proteobacteria bacterium]|nr:CarD family transcriptional regulator [Pseudomonadota bacterium]MDA1057446.1 CarD family transcriptional regulator [Pseudomonadota bacterium]
MAAIKKKAAKKKPAAAKKKAAPSKKKIASVKPKKAAAPSKPKKTAKAAKPKPAAKPPAKTAEPKSPPKPAQSISAKPPSTPPTSPKTGANVTPEKAVKAKRKLPFAINDYVVYPTHGVGRITAVEDKEISGIHLEMFVVEFDKDKMILRVPVTKVEISGMRKLATPKVMEDAMTTLKGRARVKRTMWSRRAQEYEAKINSGDPISIAEVVRDLHRNANQPEQSYSERQIYEAALDRLVREVAAVEKIDEDAAQERLQTVLRAA